MKSGFGKGGASESRVLQLITANASSLSADQTAALNNVSLGDITDFTGTLHNYWQLGIPDVQRSGVYAVTTYTPSAAGLTMKVSHSDTAFKGSSASKSVGFYRMLHQPGFDIAIDIDNIANVASPYTSDMWHVNLCVCIGGTHQTNSMFSARLQKKSHNWTCARAISPSDSHFFENGYEDSIDTGLTGFDSSSYPPAVRLRVQHSIADSGFKAYYSLNSGASYTTLEGSNGGTGFFQMHTKNSGTMNHTNKYSVGGPVYVLVTVGQTMNKGTSDNNYQTMQGECRVTFKDLS